jgi:hypothetical protein
MTVRIELPDKLYNRAKRIAQQQQQEIDQVIADLLDEALSSVEGDNSLNATYVPDPTVDREMAAYIAMHPKLLQEYLGRHVAIYDGQLVDSDEDFSALLARIDRNYPEDFVWIAQIAPEPMPTFIHRSPRRPQSSPRSSAADWM